MAPLLKPNAIAIKMANSLINNSHWLELIHLAIQILNILDIHQEAKPGSIEAVVPPGRDVRFSKSRGAIEAKREDWAATHEIHKLDADGP